MSLPGDAYLNGGPRLRTVMTRAITIEVPPERVWPWLAQLGRGAGFYSFDRLDNGGRTSARRVVSWIPEPAVGDATATGYLRRVEPGIGLTWWLPGAPFLGAWTRMVIDIGLRPSGSGTRAIVRVSGDASGATRLAVIVLFQAMDSIMAVRQLMGIKQRSEASNPPGIADETGARDQYQYYEVIYASGGSAGVPDKEQGAIWHRAAVADGIIDRERPID